jgi:hypothetical protein
MRNLIFLITLLPFVTFANGKSFSSNSPFIFVENKGQITDQFGNPRNDIDFSVKNNGVRVFIGDGALHYQFYKYTDIPKANKYDITKLPSKIKTTIYRVDVELVNANKYAQVITEKEDTYYENHYGSQSQNGITAHSFGKIIYKDVYPNIDWVLYKKGNILEYDFIIRPGGRVSDIQLRYNGASDIKIEKDGTLFVKTSMGIIKEQAPYAYQANNVPVSSSFNLHNNILTFDVGKYSGGLVIDPEIVWGTYYGGSESDVAYNVAKDQLDGVYICGFTYGSTSIATSGAFQTTFNGGFDAFLAKFNTAGNISWATYYGGTGDETARGLSVDAANNIYLSGSSTSTSGIATPGSFKDTKTGIGDDGMLIKFNPAGQRIWGTYFGGSGYDGVHDIHCDNLNNVYASGITSSLTDIATTGCHQGTYGGGLYDGFIAKFDTAGNLSWSTYYGGTGGEDAAFGVTTDASGYPYIAGRTNSTTAVATPGSQQTTFAGGTSDNFIVKFNPQGQRIWGTYYGGTHKDAASKIESDGLNVYISSTTNSENISTPGAHQPFLAGAYNGLLFKFDNSGLLQWSTYFGSIGWDEMYDLSVKNNSVYICGLTDGYTNIVLNNWAIDNSLNSNDAYIARFNLNGEYLWGTYYGGSSHDQLNAIVVDGDQIYTTGHTQSVDSISTPGSYQEYSSNLPNDLLESFLIRIHDCYIPNPDTILGDTILCPQSSEQYSVSPITDAVSYTWILPTGWSGNSNTNSINVATGTTSGTISVIANSSCGSTDTTTLQVDIFEPESLISALGDTSFCAGDSVMLSANSGAGFSYQWLLNGNPVSGATDTTYTVMSAGDYSVIVSWQSCSDTSVSQEVIVHPLPVVSITQSGFDLSTTTTFTSYQWFLNGNLISGANAQTYTTVQDGNYYVIAIDVNGCSDTSNTINITTNVTEVNSHINNLNLLPNPNNGAFTLTGNIANVEEIAIQIYNVLGEVVFYKVYPINNDEFNVPILMDVNLPEAVYILRLKTELHERTIRFLKH